MATLDIGVDYYYLNATDYAMFAAAVEDDPDFSLADFGVLEVTQQGYEGYYFPKMEIDGGTEGDEWAMLSVYNSFTFAVVWTSVQANYIGA